MKFLRLLFSFYVLNVSENLNTASLPPSSQHRLQILGAAENKVNKHSREADKEWSSLVVGRVAKNSVRRQSQPVIKRYTWSRI
jgi:hypothetical protein